tara:strand:+ start:842 stop:1579 length:738 start_codon:yes stop_codon:yes gene_type:complete
MADWFVWDEDFKLNVSRGKVRGATAVHKFGAVPELSQNTTGTAWDKNDTVYPWSSFSSAGVIVAQTANASDDGKKVTVLGLDSDYNETSEVFTLSSSGTVTGSVNFIRVYRAFISEGDNNVGTITFQKGGTDVLLITAGKGQTLMAIYTVPAGYTGYLYQGTASAESGADATGDMFVRYFGQSAFRIGHTFEVAGAGGEYNYQFTFPVQIPEKSDIDVRFSTRTNNGRYTASFDILLVQEVTIVE